MKAQDILYMVRKGYSKEEIDEMDEEVVVTTIELLEVGYGKEEIEEIEFE